VQAIINPIAIRWHVVIPEFCPQNAGNRRG
jgi:hypothetical protein